MVELSMSLHLYGVNTILKIIVSNMLGVTMLNKSVLLFVASMFCVLPFNIANAQFFDRLKDATKQIEKEVKKIEDIVQPNSPAAEEAPAEQQSSIPVRDTRQQATRAPSRNTQRAPRRAPPSAPTDNFEQDVVLSYTENGIIYRGTYKADKAMYFERPASYTVRSIQADINGNVQHLLNIWGVELQEVTTKSYDGVRQTPFENPTSGQSYFNQSLARGDYGPNGYKSADVFLPRISRIVPGGMFDRLGAKVGDYIQRIYDGPTRNSENESVTGYLTLENLVADFDRWYTQSDQPYRYTLILDRLGYRAQDLWIETAITPSLFASFGPQAEERKKETKYANMIPNDSLANTTNITYPGGNSSVLIKSMTEGSFAQFLFWKTEDNDLLLERMNELIFPAATEAYSDVCRAYLVDPIEYTPVRNVFVGEDGLGIPGGVVTRYYEQVEGKTIHMERSQLALYQAQLGQTIPTLFNISQDLLLQSDQLVPFMYEAFPKIAATTDEFRTFFTVNGCGSVGKTFMANFADFLQGKQQEIDGDNYPTMIKVYAESEEHLYAYVPSGSWPEYIMLPGTKFYGVGTVGQREIEGYLSRESVGVTALSSLANPKFDRQKTGMTMAMNEARLTGSKGIECSYQGRQNRYFWKEVNSNLSPETIQLLSVALEPRRDSCPLNYNDM